MKRSLVKLKSPGVVINHRPLQTSSAYLVYTIMWYSLISGIRASTPSRCLDLLLLSAPAVLQTMQDHLRLHLLLPLVPLTRPILRQRPVHMRQRPRTPRLRLQRTPRPPCISPLLPHKSLHHLLQEDVVAAVRPSGTLRRTRSAMYGTMRVTSVITN